MGYSGFFGRGLYQHRALLASGVFVLLAACETPADCENSSQADGCPEAVMVLTPEPDHLRVAQVFEDCQDCPQMVVVPAGSFQMGDLRVTAPMRDADEWPNHPVTITQDFAIGRYEVTFDEWDICVSEGGCRAYRPNDNGWGPARRPVIEVSWDDARAYTAWLSDETGRDYRLPSEAEWEYAARAGTSSPWHFGETISSGDANFDANIVWDGSVKGTFLGQTMPVGRYGSRANAFGLYDVHGNVAEWTQDCYTQDYQGSPSGGEANDVAMGETCAFRTLRGGSWIDGAWGARSAWRHPVAPGERHNFVGFRVARHIDR